MFNSFKEISEKVKTYKKSTIVVPIAEDEASITAIVDAHKMGLINAILIGNKKRMEEGMRKFSGEGLQNYEVIEIDNPEEAAKKACLLCREKKADFILKGHLQTSQLLKAVLNSETGLRSGNLMSHIFIYEDPLARGKRLMGMTDGGINILPNVDQKRQIIENAVQFFHKLGNKNPKVALLSAVEKPTPAMPSTVEAVEIRKMYEEGKIKGCIVDGPFALDNAILKSCAEIKGIKSDVAGEADILVVPNIEAGNIFAKALIFYDKVEIGHIMVGAKIPVLATSRADDAIAKIHTIMLGLIAGRES